MPLKCAKRSANEGSLSLKDKRIKRLILHRKQGSGPNKPKVWSYLSLRRANRNFNKINNTVHPHEAGEHSDCSALISNCFPVIKEGTNFKWHRFVKFIRLQSRENTGYWRSFAMTALAHLEPF